MAAATAARWRTGSVVQTSRLGVGRMARPPGGGHSLEDGDHFGNGTGGQDGGLWPRLPREVSTGDRDVAESTRKNLDLTMAAVPRQRGNAGQFQHAAEKGMGGIGHCDLTFAFLGAQRCITLVGV
jgi:hypothetical protein